MDDHQQQFSVESERALATIDQALQTMDQFGGNLDIFSYTMMRASLHLFAEVHNFADLERAVTHMLNEEQKHRQPCGRA